MKYILWALAACCIFVGGAAVVSGSNRSSNRLPQNHPITLSQRVQRAKESGRKNVYLPAPIPFYAEVDSLDEAISKTTLVAATPIEKTTVLLDPESIVTFYRLKIADSLSPGIPSKIWLRKSLPSELPALNSNETYLQVGGGAITIDDVTIHEEEEFGGLQLSQQYLFFLSQDPSRTVSMVQLGKDGIFKVTEDGGLENIASSKGDAKDQSLRRVKSAIEQDLERLHGNSLIQLKANIKK
jgi:hypothetical protein